MGEYREPVQTREDVEEIRNAAARIRSLNVEWMLAISRSDHRAALKILSEIRETRERIRERYKIII